MLKKSVLNLFVIKYDVRNKKILEDSAQKLS